MYQPTTAATTLVADQLPIMLTCGQASGILNCSEKHVRDMCREGSIRATKVGSAWRIPRDQFLTAYGLL